MGNDAGYPEYGQQQRYGNGDPTRLGTSYWQALVWNPNQNWLLPLSAQDWLPENDLVYFLLDVVNELDISAITQKYQQEERGYPPYHPRMMVVLLFYAYC